MIDNTPPTSKDLVTLAEAESYLLQACKVWLQFFAHAYQSQFVSEAKARSEHRKKFFDALTSLGGYSAVHTFPLFSTYMCSTLLKM